MLHCLPSRTNSSLASPSTRIGLPLAATILTVFVAFVPSFGRATRSWHLPNRQSTISCSAMLQASCRPDLTPSQKGPNYNNKKHGKKQNENVICVVNLLGRKRSKTKKVGTTCCSCIKAGSSCLALCVWPNITERGAWQNSVFCSNEHGDARDMLMFVQQKKGGRKKREHFLEPTAMCGQVFLSRKERRERSTSCSCFANARQSTSGTWLAGGEELRPRVDGRNLHERLRVPPSRFFCFSSLGTRNCGNRALESFRSVTKMGHERGVGTPEHRRRLAIPTLLYLHNQARPQKKPSCMWPGRPPAVCF